MWHEKLGRSFQKKAFWVMFYEGEKCNISSPEVTALRLLENNYIYNPPHTPCPSMDPLTTGLSRENGFNQ